MQRQKAERVKGDERNVPSLPAAQLLPSVSSPCRRPTGFRVPRSGVGLTEQPSWRCRRVRSLEGLDVRWLEAEEKVTGKWRVVDVLAMARVCGREGKHGRKERKVSEK